MAYLFNTNQKLTNVVVSDKNIKYPFEYSIMKFNSLLQKCIG